MLYFQCNNIIHFTLGSQITPTNKIIIWQIISWRQHFCSFSTPIKHARLWALILSQVYWIFVRSDYKEITSSGTYLENCAKINQCNPGIAYIKSMYSKSHNKFIMRLRTHVISKDFYRNFNSSCSPRQLKCRTVKYKAINMQRNKIISTKWRR